MMMDFTEAALRLTKKYASGALCKIDFSKLENTMFYPYYLLIAQKMGSKKITIKIVREYWLRIHNQLVVERFNLGLLKREEAKNCLVKLRKSGNRFFAVHNNRTVDILSPHRAKLLLEETEKLPRILR